ncbi:MAG: pyridoxamine 5'-phosphate oxidase family protein [Dehalococcoidia bacterium]|nr:pyridoxamine 5'-phosphate oxidase family protein [Dehalococcoidia bacterium]
MELTPEQREFFSKHHGAAMTTLRRDGTPHTVRVGCVLIGDVLWSSGNVGRLRTLHLRRDPRATLMVFNSRGDYLTAEARVRLLEGDDVPDLSIRLFRTMAHEPDAPADAPINFGGRSMTPDEFRAFIRNDGRLIYEFEPVRVYGSI